MKIHKILWLNKLNIKKNALKYEYDYEKICKQIRINFRIPESEAAKTTLIEYLLSRSIAGMNAFEMIENIERVTADQITGRFFPFYPPKNINLIAWLTSWIRKGFIFNKLVHNIVVIEFD